MYDILSLIVCSRMIILSSYLAGITITSDRTANLDLYLTAEMVLLLATLLRQEASIFKFIFDRPVIITSRCRAFGKGAIITYFNVLGLTWPRAWLKLPLPDAKRERYR
jgi:hypothetical protein